MTIKESLAARICLKATQSGKRLSDEALALGFLPLRNLLYDLEAVKIPEYNLMVTDLRQRVDLLQSFVDARKAE